MRDRWLCRSLCLLVVSLAVTTKVSAQTKPRFVIAVDTSGSMTEDLTGKTTYGDGVGRVATGADATALVKDGVFYGCGTTAGVDRDCNGFPDDSKISIAKNAIRNMVLGYGDVEWSLEKFHQTQAANTTCTNYTGNTCTNTGNTNELCGCQSYGNPACNTGTVDNSGCTATIPVACRPGSGSNASLKVRQNADFNGCINYAGGCFNGTAADLLVGFNGFAPFDAQDNRPAILKWMDNVETSFSTSTTSGNFCNHATTGDCELRANGNTPLGALIQTSGTYMAGIKSSDTRKSCRQYSTIVVTDGADTCFPCAANPNNALCPNNAAFALAYPTGGATCNPAALPAGTPVTKTYVVGISIVAGEQSQLNDIAKCGGTGQAYFASSAAELSAALSKIVNDSIKVEVCNGLDDDCDGAIDEDLPVGQPGADPQPDAQFCDKEGQRSSAQNVLLQNYGGSYASIAQTTPVAPKYVCGKVKDTCADPFQDDDCDGKVDEDDPNLTSCGTCPGADDVCDGIDNDCDGYIDEIANSHRPFSACPITCTGTVPCGSAVGECRQGVYACTNNVLDTSTCVGAQGPRTEVCDLKDNDCNGIVDDPGETARTCNASNVGICQPGVQFCAKMGEPADGMGYRVDGSGHPYCVGQVGPEDRELCDNLDHDCDGNNFTCTNTTCVIGPDPVGVGDACGQGTGACRGVYQCNTMSNPPTLICNATGGTDEICDNLDNDCDGKVDEGLGTGGPCGSSIGECRPGSYICDDQGQQTCVGGVGPVAEVCDALDNDCDGKVDEGLGLGDTCGSDVGVCKPGKLACASGRLVCAGEVGPQLETCDCVDNDCDGKIDEDTGDNPVCPSGSACTMCQCALPCAATAEFLAACPQGKAPVTDTNGCYCVGAQCEDRTCAGKTIQVDDAVQCAPTNKLVAQCACKNNECTFACSGVTCSEGLVCDPTDGRCKQDSCLLPQFACSGDQRCGLLDSILQCVADACAGVTCDADQACRDGNCVKSCAGVTCEDSQKCVDGDCQGSACATPCSGNQTCDPTSGKCVVNGPCVANGCGDGRLCDPVSGECGEDPCLRTHCPTAQVCNSITSQCEARCSGNQVYCDNTCIDPQASRTHCGASADCTGDNAGQSCSSGLVCSLGTCSSNCAQGLLNCGSVCVDPRTSADYCGASADCKGTHEGTSCTAGLICKAGVCVGDSTTKTTPNKLFVATGGGGCACSVGPGSTTPPGGSSRPLASLLLMAAAWWLRRSRRLGMWLRLLARSAPRALPWLALGGLLLCSGCKLKPLCLDCVEDAGKAGGTLFGDASMVQPTDSGGPILATDGSLPDAATSGDGAAALGDGAVLGDGGVNCNSIEICNGKDDDCDGKIDEDTDPATSGINIQTDPTNCGACGKVCTIEHAFNICTDGQCAIDRSAGSSGCDIGFVDLDGDASNGCEFRCTKSAPDDSICDLVDNDCDGHVDEDVKLDSDPKNCGSCNLRCLFAHASDGAQCVNKACVLDNTRCDNGFVDVDQRMITGCEYRCPVVPSVAETCNGVDDDCDGLIDENVTTADDPRINVACGSMAGECRLGMTICMLGAPVCMGATVPTSEICDGKDNNCDGTADEGFDTSSDVANCGACGNKCLFDSSVNNGHAVLACQTGHCRVGSCIGNFTDANGDYRDGCEQSCTVTGSEICDGVDNDCNGLIDDNVLTPSVVCASYETGVCAASPSALARLRTAGPKCVNGVLSCDVVAAGSNGGIANFISPENNCDTRDNDCDGRIDETFPSVGRPCTNGTGACQTTGTYVCDSMQMVGYSCNAPAPLAGTPEACDGADNDCNGVIDDFAAPGTSNAVTGFSFVNLGGGTLMMTYEASKPDATDVITGTQTSKPCSATNKLPWADVTWGEASAACCALNTNGQCQGGGKGWRLCDSTTWDTACKGTGAACTWGYDDRAPDAPTMFLGATCAHDPRVATFSGVCRGSEGTFSGCPSGTPQCAAKTGAFADCKTKGTSLFDLSGNLKEWTNTSHVTTDTPPVTVYELRGGSYNNVEQGRACDFNFTVGDGSFRFPNAGFRCCFYP
jgi:hypothetical protein